MKTEHRSFEVHELNGFSLSFSSSEKNDCQDEMGWDYYRYTIKATSPKLTDNRFKKKNSPETGWKTNDLSTIIFFKFWQAYHQR